MHFASVLQNETLFSCICSGICKRIVWLASVVATANADQSNVAQGGLWQTVTLSVIERMLNLDGI